MPTCSPKTTSDPAICVGLMSGTSLDAVDAVLLEVTANRPPRMLRASNHPIPAHVRNEILALCQPGPNELLRLGQLDRELGALFAEATLKLLESASYRPDQITAIGSHGQTVRHQPAQPNAFSMQLGSADEIATRTGIPVVHNFRNKDMVLGGQGAPLVPRFHQTVFSEPDKTRAIINIGGMANTTILKRGKIESGFDTGPGNVLINHWHQEHKQQPFDQNGDWARQGEINKPLLDQMLADPFFQQPPPKSTGREYFNSDWLKNHTQAHIPPEDMQATLLELTAQSIADAILPFAVDQVFICGGGAHNRLLMERLSTSIHAPVADTTQAGLHPDWVEACAFAWLAWARLNQVTGNTPSVTGASRKAILGSVTLP